MNKISNFLKEYGPAMYLGGILPLCGISPFGYKWFAIIIPTFILFAIREYNKN